MRKRQLGSNPLLYLTTLGAFSAFPLLPQAPEQALTLRSNARLVQLDVVAEDKKGHLVGGLTKENFQVYDAGKLQELRIFTKNAAQSSQPSGPLLNPRDGVSSTFTNMAEARSGPGAVTVILIDSLNTKWVNQTYAKQQLIKFLTQLHPDDHVAIYSMGFAGFRVLQDFTHDSSSLVAQLASWKGEPKVQAISADSSHPDIGQEQGDWLKGRNPDFIQSQQMGDADQSGTVRSLQILTAIANQLASIPGRKNLIWISEGFPLVDWSGLINLVYDSKPAQLSPTSNLPRADPTSFHNELTTAMRTISDDNVAIYPVDARCLFDPFYSASSRDSTAAGFKAFSGIHAREEAMDNIAKRTGGKAFYETNDLKRAIRLAMDDEKTTYTLGFYPDPVQSSGKFHTFKVRVVGRPDVRLRYRQGYIDSQEPSRNESDRRARLQNAAWSPLDANAIGLSATLESSEGMEHLELKINPADLNASDTRTARIIEADIFIVQTDGSGKQLEAAAQTARAGVNPNGFTFNYAFTLNPNISKLRIVVGDMHSDRLGSISVSNSDLPH